MPSSQFVEAEGEREGREGVASDRIWANAGERERKEEEEEEALRESQRTIRREGNTQMD